MRGRRPFSVVVAATAPLFLWRWTVDGDGGGVAGQSSADGRMAFSCWLKCIVLFSGWRQAVVVPSKEEEDKEEEEY